MKRKEKFNSRCIIFTLILLISVNSIGEVSAQENRMNTSFENRMDQMMPAINEASGKVLMEIPLVSLSSGGVPMNISLTYSYAGYKITDVASWVGRGWQVSGIGTVNRTTNGLPDDKALQIAGNVGNNYEGGYLRNGRSLTGNWDDQNGSSPDISLVRSGKIDLLPDVFSYSGPGISGAFIFKRGESWYKPKILELPFVGNKIRPIVNSFNYDYDQQYFSSFEITNLDGLKYVYDERDFARITEGTYPCFPADNLPEGYANPSYTGSFVSNWLQTGLINQFNQEVYSFTYYPPQTYKYQMPSAKLLDRGGFYEYEHCTDIYEYHKKQIHEIHFNSGYVKFIMDSEVREDMAGTKALSEILVFKYVDDGNPLLVKKIKFTYDYSSCCGDNLPTNMRNLKALRLRSLKMYNGNDQIVDEYEFDYYIGNAENKSVAEMVVAKDYWGYMNDGFNNQMAVPSGDVDIYPYTPANMEPSFDQMKEGALSEILNYTKGTKVSIAYEDNDFSKYGNMSAVSNYKYPSGIRKGPGLRVKEIYAEDGNGSRYKKSYIYKSKDNPNLSSGVLIDNPIFDVTWTNLSGSHSFTDLSSNAYNVSSFAGESPIIYTDVEVVYYGYDENEDVWLSFEEVAGRKVSRYTFAPNEGTPSKPFLPLFRPFWARGNLESEVVYNSHNEIIRTLHNEYSRSKLDLNNGAGIAKASLFARASTSPPLLPVVVEVEVEDFRTWNSEKFYLSSTKSFTYGENGSDLVNKKIFYDNETCMLPTRIEVSKSDGITRIQKIKYLDDYEYDLYQYPPAGSFGHMIMELVEANEVYGRNYKNFPIEEATFLLYPDSQEEYLLNSKINYYNRFYIDSSMPTIPVSRPLAYSIYTELDNPILNYEMSKLDVVGSTIVPSFVYDESIFTGKSDEVIYVNDFALPFEISHFHGGSSSVIRKPNTGISIAHIQGGRYFSSRYTSFEDEYHGGWNPNNDYVETVATNDHTPSGKSFYKLTDQSKFNSILVGDYDNDEKYLPAGTYLLSFWSREGELAIQFGSGSTVLKESSVERNGWVYHEKEFRWTSDGNWITMDVATNDADGVVHIDELRLHEIDATMTTKGYYPDGKLLFEGDPGGRIVNFEYDAKGRVRWMLDAENHVINYFEYQDKNPEDVNSFHVRHSYTPVRFDMTKQEVENAGLSNTEVKKRTEYTDGFGRFRQAVDWRIAMSTKSRVSFAEYDPFGRELKKYLPYLSPLVGNEGYIQDVKTNQANYYQNKWDPQEVTSAPFVETVVENSPLQRPIEKGGVGEELQPGMGHSTTVEYGYNTADDQIMKWDFQNGIASSTDNYAPAQLRKTKTIDGDGRVTITYTDLRGRQIAVQSLLNSGINSHGNIATGTIDVNNPAVRKITSYTVYDVFDRPVMEIPAIAVERMAENFTLNTNATTGVFADLITYRHYDTKGRVAYRNVPGQGRVEYVYDNKDRVILTRNAQQKHDGKWSFVKYDTRGRVVIKGEIISTQDREAHQILADLYEGKGENFEGAGGSVFGYTNLSHPPVSENDVFNVYYFDGYNFEYPLTSDYVPFDDITQPTEMTRGLATGSKTRILNTDNTLGGMLTTVSWYDDDQRPIQAFTENHLGGYDRVDTYYNEREQVEKTVQTHLYDANADAHTFTTRYVYDVYSGRQIRTYCKLDDDPEVLVGKMEYDDDGKLRRMGLHRPEGVDKFMQNIDYRYNDQGRLTHINNSALIVDAFNEDDNDVFGQELTYFDLSPEYDPTDPSNKTVIKQYGGNVSSMTWNAKTPEQDGSVLDRHAYFYLYDDFGQLIHADYASDAPSTPGVFKDDPGFPVLYDESVDYDLGGNITRLNRSQNPLNADPLEYQRMDELVYDYGNAYQLKSVNDAGDQGSTNYYRHFTDGANQTEEYIYDKSGRLTQDKNRHTTFEYNPLNLPRRTSFLHQGHSYQIRYLYDAAGNKMQKQVETFDCPPNTPCPPPGTATTDYLGNFYYENGNLRAVYHPHGLIRPTPPSAENTTDYVYDYYIKDYLGNVRVVLTEENATYETAMVATMEEYRAEWEEENFENIEEGREPVPYNYPVDASFPLNQYIARIIADNDMTIGPSKVLEVSEGDKVQVATQYFFEENAPGATYEDLGFLIEEILVSMAAAGAGVLPVGEGALLNLINGNTSVGNEVFQFLSTKMDTTDMTRPHGYLVWLAYDKNFNLVPDGSGALRVTDPNELGTLFSGEIPIAKTGYLHVYVSNGTEAKTINFDNLYITTMQGKTRQINHYYPYGLRMRMGHGQRYTQMYTTKELQTGEYWDASVSTGLEMYDFDARFYDPQLGRWFVPDPAEQFSNPYLAMGNNPVMYVDPDGEFVWLVPVIAGVVFGGVNLGIQASNGEINNFGDGLAAFGSGFIAGAAIATGVGAGLSVPILGTAIKVAGITYGASLGLGTVVGLGDGIFNNDWHKLENTWKQFGGNFYLDGNKNFFGQTWQGISRFSWELPQSTIGHAYSQIRNAAGGVDRVDYLGGATFSTNENTKHRQGISLGNFINIDIDKEIEGNFQEYVTGNPEKGIPGDPLFMHEYGHTFDSRLFGPLYLPGIGFPSALMGAEWTEKRANRHAAKYFERYYGVDWDDFSGRYPLR